MTHSTDNRHRTFLRDLKKRCFFFKAVALVVCILALGLVTPFALASESRHLNGEAEPESAQLGCTYQLSRTSFVGMPGTGIVLEINVSTAALCSWNTFSNVSWIKVTSPPWQIGSGKVNLSVNANISETGRTGTVIVAGKTVTLTQDGVPCGYPELNRQEYYPASGGQLALQVYAWPHCSWSASSNANWLVITNGASGTGSIYLNITVKPNDSLNKRTGKITGPGYTLTVEQSGACAAITFDPNYLPDIEVNKPYTKNLSASGGTAPYQISLSAGTLPTGLQLKGNSLSGTPTVTGIYKFTLKATDANGCTGTRGFTVNVGVACQSITVGPASLSAATVGTAIQPVAFTANNAQAGYGFSLSAGTLPPGMQLSGNVLSGTPTAAGTYSFTVKAVDSRGCKGENAYIMTVNGKACPTITIGPAAFPPGATGNAYTQNFIANGGAAPYQFSVSAGSLPAGLSLGSNGALTGVPTEPGIANVTIKATDANGCQGTRTYVLTIAPTKVVSVSAASYLPGAAPDSIVAAFGVKLASDTQVANSQPLPTALAKVSVRVKDSSGIERLAPLFFVSPGQINYQVPPGTTLGTATVSVINDNQLVAAGTLEITNVAPGLFTANSNGKGVPTAVALRIKSNGSQSYEPVAEFKNNQFVTMPIDLGLPGEQVFLVLYGTGFRYRQNLSVVITTLGGDSTGEVLYAGIAPGFIGLDQVNVRVPRTLIGRNEIDLSLIVEGKVANVVRVNIK